MSEFNFLSLRTIAKPLKRKSREDFQSFYQRLWKFFRRGEHTIEEYELIAFYNEYQKKDKEFRLFINSKLAALKKLDAAKQLIDKTKSK